jgi:hypothetical protein
MKEFTRSIDIFVIFRTSVADILKCKLKQFVNYKFISSLQTIILIVQKTISTQKQH